MQRSAAPSKDSWYVDAEIIVQKSGVAPSYRAECVRLLRALPLTLGPFDRDALVSQALDRARSGTLRAHDLAFVRQTFEIESHEDLLARFFAKPEMTVVELRELVLYAELANLVDTMLRSPVWKAPERGTDRAMITRALEFQLSLVRDAEAEAKRKLGRQARACARRSVS